MADPLSYTLTNLLLNCFCNALNVIAADDPTLPAPKTCCLRAGSDVIANISIDGSTDSCCDGLGYVKMVNIFPSVTFPTLDDGSASPCNLNRLALTLEIGTLRCLSQDDCASHATAMRLLASDHMAALKAVCCWADSARITLKARPRFNAGIWTTAGPEGNCISGTMQVQMSIPGCSC